MKRERGVPGPLITLLTDFGAGSGYPAQMKAIILRAAPGAVIVDISHEVPAFDMLAGALLLEACVPWFPDAAVHCSVIDPGVGTSRLPLAIVDPSGRRFVGPDNGVFTPFLGPGSVAYELAHPVGVPPRRSSTFHGRDLFAPVAAWLALGGDPVQLGPRIDDPVRIRWPEARREGNRIHGECLMSDAFGNVITSLRAIDLGPTPHDVAVDVAGLTARLVMSFGHGSPGELVAVIGSSGRVEIAIREGNAARTHALTRGMPVVLTVR